MCAHVCAQRVIVAAVAVMVWRASAIAKFVPDDVLSTDTSFRVDV